MTTIDPSGSDADDIATSARANATLSRLMEATPATLPDAERLRLAAAAYGHAMAKAANDLARQRLFAAYNQPRSGPRSDIQAITVDET